MPKAKIEVLWECKQLEELYRLDKGRDVMLSVKDDCICESKSFPREAVSFGAFEMR